MHLLAILMHPWCILKRMTLPLSYRPCRINQPWKGGKREKKKTLQQGWEGGKRTSWLSKGDKSFLEILSPILPLPSPSRPLSCSLSSSSSSLGPFPLLAIGDSILPSCLSIPPGPNPFFPISPSGLPVCGPFSLPIFRSAKEGRSDERSVERGK